MPQSLQTLLEGLYSSVLEARHYVNAQHLKLFESYFDTTTITDPDTGKKVEAYTPKLITIATSKGVGAGETYDITDAPLLSLIKLTHLSVDSLEIEFEAKLTNLSEVAKEDAASAPPAPPDERGIIRRAIDGLFGTSMQVNIMSKSGSFDSGASPAKVKIIFKATEAPEGIHLIQEQMLDYIRQ